MHKIILPELGEGVQKATVACWHRKPGEKVKEGEDIVELVTDKASFNVPTDRSGIVKEILVQEGEEANINDTLAIIEC